MGMKRLRLFLVLACAWWGTGCSTSESTSEVATGGAAGSAGAVSGGLGSDTATGGKASASDGGSAGAPPLGGAAGAQAFGGAAGASSSGGAGGAGGASPEPVYVTCGDVQCPVHDGGQCCYVQTDDVYVCQTAGATCHTKGSGPYEPQYPFTCDGTADCPDGQVCCYTGSSAGPIGGAECADTCPPPKVSPRFQICDPDNVAPSDCLAGSCQPNEGPYGPPALYYCQ